MDSSLVLPKYPLLLLVVVACSQTPPPARSKTRTAKVRLAEAQAGPLAVQWRFSGDARARARSSLAAGASGAVERLQADVGQVVRQGELLVEVDKRLAAAQVSLAKAEVEEAKESLQQALREAKRFDSLAQGVVAEIERDQVESRVSTLRAALGAREAELRSASASLALHRIRAPFSGVVTQRFVDLGAWVNPGDPALELVSTDRVEIFVNASSELAGQVAAGDTAYLFLAGSEPVPLDIAGIVPALDPGSRTMTIRLEPKRRVSILPGQPVEVEFRALMSTERGVVVPSDALLFDGSGYRVVRSLDGEADFVPVELVARAGTSALVEGELAVGDRLVIRGNERVRPGQALELAEES